MSEKETTDLRWHCGDSSVGRAQSDMVGWEEREVSIDVASDNGSYVANPPILDSQLDPEILFGFLTITNGSIWHENTHG